MRTSLGRPAALAGALAVVVAGFVPTAVSVAADGWLPSGGYLVFQAMLTVAGLLLWWSRESHRHAALLLLAGVLVGVGNLDTEWSRDSATYLTQVGWLFQWGPVPLVATVLLEHPEGRSRSRSRRLLVAGFWVWALGVRVVTAPLWSPADAGYTGPARWLTLYPANAAVRVIEGAGTVLLGVLVVWFVAVEIGRWRGARGAARVTVRLVALAGIVLAVGLLLRVLWGYAVEAGWVHPRAEPWIAGSHAASGALAAAVLVAVALQAATRRGAVVERLLAAGGDGDGVQGVLADALGDPTLRLRFAVGAGWVGVDGRAAGAAPGGRVTRVLLREDGEPVVEVDAEDHVLLDPATLRVTLAAASVVLQNARLTVERTAHLAEVQASRARIVEAGIAQRRELERNLHDGAQQSLLAVSATLSRASMATEADDMREVVDEARTGLTAALAEVRRLARGIHPAALSQGGLVTGLEALAAGSRAVELSLDPDLVRGRRYPPSVESTAYYVVAEAVTNAVKHAGPGAVRVAVAAEPDAVTVSVTDGGPGGAHPEPGGGLAGLADRVRALGGVLTVDSPVGRGTTVSARLPERPPL